MKFFLYLISTIPAFIEVSNASIDVLSRDEVEDLVRQYKETTKNHPRVYHNVKYEKRQSITLQTNRFDSMNKGKANIHGNEIGKRIDDNRSKVHHINVKSGEGSAASFSSPSTKKDKGMDNYVRAASSMSM